MSAIFAVLGPPAAAEEGSIRRMLDQSRVRGGDVIRISPGEHELIGVCRAEWEMGPDFADGELVLERAGLVVAADARLYYRDDLKAVLRARGIRPEGESPSHLIAAAYQALGADLVDVIDGDYAFVLWDRQRRQLVAACDFTGTRPLFFAEARERLILGSRLSAVAAHPALPREINRLVLAEHLIGASSMVLDETAYRNARRVPAGWRLLWQPGKPARLEQYWEPPHFDAAAGPDSDDAAEQLRALLRAAVRERLASTGPTAVLTSGGYDSPAVLALAHAAARAEQRRVLPVSMSYPVGDPGREDELIEAVGRHLALPIHWVQVGDVPGFDSASSWARRRDEPLAHGYEEWNRALVRGARDAGARVVLGGNGGDQFFSVSPIFLADLLRSGRWLAMAREAGALRLGLRNIRELFHWAVQPCMAPWAFQMAQRVRGRALRPHLQSVIPDWFGLDRATVEALRERQWHYFRRRADESFGSAETSWYLTASFGPRISAAVAGFGLSEGAETRSPMYDRRVIEFMARRSREDRFSMGENKRLLRRALRGLLPDEHLAPRKTRTGLAGRYLQRARREAVPRWLELMGPRTRLGELGLVDAGTLRRGVERYLRNPRWEGSLAGELFDVFSAEFWLREHADPVSSSQALVA
jgi:asparagine synthase (glutamine-hydrolysing)